MKKIKVMICAALIGAGLMSAASASELGDLSPQGAKAYLDQIQLLQKIYGRGQVDKTGGWSNNLWKGISLVELIDFDGDKIPELYCSAGMDGQWLYTYDEELRQLAIPEKVSNFGTDVSPSTLLYIGKDKAYLVDGQEVMNGGIVSYLTKNGNEMTAALTYMDAMGDEGEHICKVNGNAATYETLRSTLKTFTQGMVEKDYSYWNISDIGASPKGTVTKAVTALRTLANPVAQVSTDKLTIDGKPVSLASYRINGNNYYKLRDIANALSGTNAQFDVAWNAAENRIDLRNDTAYTPGGGEQQMVSAGKKTAALTAASVYLDGDKLELTVYQIDGNNYFKLRDLSKALDFGVAWNEASRTIQVDTSMGCQE